MEATSAGTSLLIGKKINFGSSPTANNTYVCSSHSASALLQSLSSSLTSSSTSEESKFTSFGDYDIYDDVTNDLGHDVVNLEKTSHSTNSAITSSSDFMTTSSCSTVEIWKKKIVYA